MSFDPWADEGVDPVEAPHRLLAIEFDEPLLAQEALLAALRLAAKDAVHLDDAAIVVKDGRGKVRIHQTKDISTTQGAATGTWFGLVGGLLFMAPFIGAAIGAAVGGIWAKLRDIGIDDDEMKRWGERLEPGRAALFLLVDVLAPTTLIREMRRFNGSLLHHTLDDDLASAIADSLDEVV